MLQAILKLSQPVFFPYTKSSLQNNNTKIYYSSLGTWGQNSSKQYTLLANKWQCFEGKERFYNIKLQLKILKIIVTIFYYLQRTSLVLMKTVTRRLILSIQIKIAKFQWHKIYSRLQRCSTAGGLVPGYPWEVPLRSIIHINPKTLVVEGDGV